MKDIRLLDESIGVVDRANLPDPPAGGEPGDVAFCKFFYQRRVGLGRTVFDDNGLSQRIGVAGKEAVERLLQQILPAAAGHNRGDLPLTTMVRAIAA